jgi:hypothetical protein
METERQVFDISGPLGIVGKAVLGCLYKHANGTIGTKDLMKILRPSQNEVGQEQKAYEEIQGAIEKLLLARLVTGKRVPESEKVYHIKLRLTPKGEVEALRQRDLPDTLVVDLPRPDWTKASS